MGLFKRRSGPSGAAKRSVAGRLGGRGGLSPEDRGYLEAFAASRRGVEAYLEPATTVTPVTMVLIAHDGEWTRRPVESVDDGRAFAQRAGIPVYEVHATGYPPRMRAWSAARRREGATAPVRAERPRPSDGELPPDPFV